MTEAPHERSDTAETGGRRGLGVPYEAQVFGRMAAFGILVGAGYWFLTYEAAGSVMLEAFGIASAVATIAIVLGSRRGRHAPRTPTATTAQIDARAAVRDVEPLPAPGWTPVAIAIGLGGVALGLTLGPWLLIAGLGVTLVGAKGWLDVSMTETDAARGRSTPVDEGR
ncbi:MAG TPA: cytochrome c oxidase subunit 4 [Candidatus Limnocylindrales bacterium]|nr:cytochrome c oxidase subunit 4 [Candidatus Limnocylindrales bacterium]